MSTAVTSLRSTLPLALVATMMLGAPAMSVAGDEAADAVRRGIGSVFGAFGSKKTQQDTQQSPQDQDKKKETEQSATAPPATEEKTMEQAQRADRVKGTAVGAAVGAAAGAAIKDDDRLKGAAIGALAGGAAGFLVGNTMARKRGDYAARYAELDEAIAVAGQKNQSLREESSRIESRTALREAQIKAATARNASNEAAIEATLKMLNEVNKDLLANAAASENAEVAIRTLDNELKALGGDAQADVQLASREAELKVRRTELLATLERLRGTDAKLAAQRDLLNARNKG